MAATKFRLIFLLVLVSLYVSFGYSLSTRDAVSEQEDGSYVMATNDEGSSMIIVEDLSQTLSLQALVDGSILDVNEAVPKRRSMKGSKSSSKSSKKKSSKNKKKSKSKSINAGTLAGIIIAVAIVIIICVLLFFYLRHKEEKAQRIAKEKNKETSSTTSKPEVHV